MSDILSRQVKEQLLALEEQRRENARIAFEQKKAQDLAEINKPNNDKPPEQRPPEE